MYIFHLILVGIHQVIYYPLRTGKLWGWLYRQNLRSVMKGFCWWSPRLELKKYCFLKKILIIIFNFNVLWCSSWNFVLLSFNLTNLTLDRQIDIICADYFKVSEKLVKSGSFANFWFVGSRNWLIIHKSRTLNAISGP